MGLLNISSELAINNSVNELSSVVDIALPYYNLFNKNDVTSGFSLNTSGILIANTPQFTSGYIRISTKYGNNIFSRYATRMCVYDSTKKFLRYADSSSDTSGISMPISEGDCYIRVSMGASRLTDASPEQIEYGTAFTTYHPFNPSVVEETKIIASKLSSEFDYNLVDKEKYIYDSYIKQDGTIAALTNSFLTDYIKVDRLIYPTLNFILRSGNSARTSLEGICFYDHNYNMIYWNRTANTVTSPISIPENAAYVRFMCPYASATPNKIWFVVKYGCFPISILETVNYKEPEGENLFEPLNKQNLCLTGNASVSYTDNSSCSAMIPVQAGKKYYIKCNSTYFYTANKNRSGLQRVLSDQWGFWQCPDDVAFVMFTLNNGTNQLYVEGDYFGITPIDEVTPKLIKDNEDVSVSHTDNYPPFTNVGKILGIFENYIVFQNTNGVAAYAFSNNGFSGPFTTFNMSVFPNVISGSSIDRVVFFYTASKASRIGAIILSNKNQIWCSTIAPAYDSSNTYNTGDVCSKDGQNYKCLTDSVTGTWDATKWQEVSNAFSYFEESIVWDVKGNHHWRIADDDTDQSGVRYRKYYPQTGEASRQNKFFWHNSPIWLNSGGQFAHGLIFGNYSTTTNGAAQAEPACLYYTGDGKNIYVQYEFGANGTYKLGSNGEESRWEQIVYGDDVDMTSFSGSYTQMTVKKRISIIPTSTETDPTEIFTYGEDLSITSISGKNITLSDASSLSVQDTIVFGGSATDDFAKLLSGTPDSSTGVAEGSVFIVKSKSGNVITVADALGNPKNNLFCRHIHGVAEFGQGICVYTGEEYPSSWFIYMEPYMSSDTDAANANNPRWQESTLRLNASADAHQRSLGVYLRSDGKMISIADSNRPYKSRLQVRGKDLIMENYGLHIFDLANIDDATNSISKIPAVNAGYSLQKLGNILFYSDYIGKTYYSTDEGDSWKYIGTDGKDKASFIGYDKNRTRFWFDFSGKVAYVIEVKK